MCPMPTPKPKAGPNLLTYDGMYEAGLEPDDFRIRKEMLDSAWKNIMKDLNRRAKKQSEKK